MTSGTGSISHMKSQHPATWSMLKFAAAKGLVVIDDASDRLSLSPDLILQNPPLYFLVTRIIDEQQSAGLGDSRAWASSK